MKGILKIIFLSLLSVIGVVGLLIGGLYLFTGFKGDIVYAESISFTSPEIIASNAVSLQIETSTENVTQKTLKLEVARGDEGIINFPEYANIGEPFFISPLKNNEGNNIGGVVNLYARYDGQGTDQSVVAECKILIDVPVSSISLNISQNKIEKNQEFVLASANQKLNEVFNIEPLNSLFPYVTKSDLNLDSSKDSIFNALQDKKIFLEIVDENNNQNSNFACFEVNGVSSTILEVEYKYVPTTDGSFPFVFTKDIKVKSKNIAEVATINVYVCKTYQSQQDVSIGNVQDNSSVVTSGKGDFLVSDYDVDNITVTDQEYNLYYNEKIRLYLNNPQVVSENNINLGINLINNGGGVVDDYLLKNNIFIGVEDGVTCQLFKIDGTSGNFINVDCDSISNDKSEWYLEINFNDFDKYYQYENSKTNENKVKLIVKYDDGEKSYEQTINLVPAIHKIQSVSPTYSSGEDKFIRKSGESLKLDNSNFRFIYENGSNATINTLGFFIPFNNNQISTIPSTKGDYKIKFSFVPDKAGVMSITQNGDWYSLANSTITITQGSIEGEIKYDSAGIATTNIENITFEENQIIYVEVDKINITKNIPSNQPIFNISINGSSQQVLESSVVFYLLSNMDNLPYLTINGLNYKVDFEFVVIDGDKYLHILDENSTYVLDGLGEFVITARLIHYYNNQMYDLGVYSNVNVYVYKQLDNFKIYSYDNTSGNYSMFTNDLSYNENNSDVKYLFITTTASQLDVLQIYIEKDLLNINFNQDFSSIDFSKIPNLTLEMAQEINKNSIQFMDFEPVFDANNSLVGFKLPYKISSVYTLSINTEIENLFNLELFIDMEENSNLVGDFIFEGDEERDSLQLKINDLVLTSAFISYQDQSQYGTQDNPLVLNATVQDGEFYWSVLSSRTKMLDELNYGFYTNAKDVLIASNFAKYEISLVGDYDLQKPSDFAYFTNLRNLTKGEFTFKNIPFYESGVLFKLKLYIDTDIASGSNEYDSIIRYYWDSEKGVFTKVINEGVRNGYDFYFRVFGLNFTIKSNTNDFNGINDTTIPIFGSNGLFSFEISGMETSLDYSQVFNMSVKYLTNSTLGSIVSISSNYSTINVLGDFAGDEQIEFRFYYGNDSTSNIILIYDGTDYKQSYTKTIASAFTIDVAKLNFEAPSTNNAFATIRYKGQTQGGTDAVEAGLVTYSMQLATGSNSLVVINSDNTFTFYNCMEESKYKINLILNTLDSESGLVQQTKVFTYEISVTSKWSNGDLILGSSEAQNSMVAGNGENYGFSKSKGTISFSDNLNAYLIDKNASNAIHSITVVFEDVDKNSSVLASQHMRAVVTNLSSLRIYSYDLNFDKEILVTITFYFDNNRDGVYEDFIYFTKTISIEKNLSLTFKNSSYKTGSNISLGFEDTFVFLRNNVQVQIGLNDTKLYSADSFEFDQTYFNSGSTEASFLVLTIKQSNETLSAGFYDTVISFKYVCKTDNINENYILSFDIPIQIEINNK